MSTLSKETLSELPADGAATKLRRRLRLIWLGSGLVLWVLVAVMAVVLVQARRAERARLATAMNPVALAIPENAPPDGAVNKSNGGSATAMLTSEKKSTAADQSTSPWDPAGIGDFVFTERSGRKVTKKDLLGHPWLIAFIFTRCAGPCPQVSGQMSELQTFLKGSDVRLVTLTVDPDFDTAEVLNRYAQTYKADPQRWLYLSGDKHKTYELINKSFKMPVMEMTGKDREPGYEVLHSTSILLVNKKGVVVQKYNARDEVDMARLRKDLAPYLSQKSATSAGGATHASTSDHKAANH